MNLITRRRALLAIAQIAATTSLISCGSSDNTEEVSVAEDPNIEHSDLSAIASVAYDLFPHETLPPELYIKVAQRVLDLNSPVVVEGIEQLKSNAVNKRWIDLDEAQRISVLTTLEKSEFFALIRSTTIDVLYKTPEMFELVGYGGSAIEKGGYLHRGFNDIDWLPATENAQ